MYTINNTGSEKKHMKRTRIMLLFLAVLSIVSLVGCHKTDSTQKKKDIILGTDLVKYDLQGIADFGFNVNLVTPKKDTKVEFVNFWGKNTQGLFVQLNDDTYDEIKDMEHKGYYIKLLGFVCKTGDADVQIDGVTLKIDGAEQKFEFRTPIKHRIRKENLQDSVLIQNYPLFIASNSYDDMEYSFEYYVENDVTIHEFTFNNFIDVKQCVISVDGKEVGDLSSFPIEVRKDSVVSFRCCLGFKDNKNTSIYDSIYCDSVLSYKRTGTDELINLTNNLVSQSVSNEEDAKETIDLLVSNN